MFKTYVFPLDKCLLDHYGGCSQSRQCLNSRDGVNCGNCADGFVEFDPINPNECNGKFCLIIYNNVRLFKY